MSESPPRPSADSILRQLVRNSALMVLARLAGAMSLILAVPVIVAKLGAEGFGVWESMLAVAGVAMVLQTVVSGTILWRSSGSYGAQDPETARRLVGIGVGATLTLVAVITPLILWQRDPLLARLQIAGSWSDDGRILLPALVAVVLLGGVNESLAAVIVGYQRAGLAALIKSAGLVATNLTAIGLLFLGWGMDALLVGYLAGFALMFAVLYPVASSLCGRISMRPIRPSVGEIKVLGSFAGLLLISNLSVIFRDHTDKVVLASLASPTATGYFSMAQRLAGLVTQVCVVIFTPFIAAVAALHARRDWLGVRSLYSGVGLWIGALAGLFGFVICTLHEPLFVLWLGQSRPEAYPYLAFLLFGVTSAIIFAGAGAALAKGIGRPGLETAYALVTLVLTLLSKPVLVAIAGPVGAVASSAVCWWLGSMFLMFYLHHKVDLPGEMIWRPIGIFLTTAALSTTGWWIAGRFPQPQDRWQAGGVLLIGGLALGIGYLGLLLGLRLVRAPPLSALLPATWASRYTRWDGDG